MTTFTPKTHDSIGRPVKHGRTKTPEYRAWQQMIQRCTNPKSQRFDRYGGRGITVCQRWLWSFENFLSDLGPRPSPDHSLGRENNDGNYEPGNVRWETIDQQNANRCDNVFLEYDGKRQTLTAWARELGIGAQTLGCRLDSGWTIADALMRSVEPRSWNNNGEVNWKRNRKRPPLSNRAIGALRDVFGGEWFRPADISAPFSDLTLLVSHGFIETEFLILDESVQREKRHRRYRISESGRLKVQEQIDRKAVQS